MENTKVKILIIDDNQKNIHFLARFFTSEGFVCTECLSGKKGLELIKTETFDLILLDYMMPEMDGLEFLKIYRKDYPMADYPVIMVTAKDDTETIVKTLESGANDFIGKPVDLDIALARVNSLLGWRVAQENLKKANLEIKELANAKSRFLANMSHEIRTPMNSILGMADLLLDSQLTGEQRQFVHMFQRSGDSLLTIINDILDISKVNHGLFNIEKLPFDILALINDLEFMMKKRASEQVVKLHIDVDKDIPQIILGDQNRIKQILVNLLGNAIKFTSNGDVTFSLKTVSVDRYNCTILFEIIDSGIGIPVERQEAVFDRFTQADESTTREYGGTGLGLSISKELVELMGGKLELTSVEGEGSNFYFKMPFQLMSSMGKELVTKNKKFESVVLIVDENQTERSTLKETLSKEFGTVLEAGSCETTIELLNELNAQGIEPAFIFLDYHLPDGTGQELAFQIEEDLQFKNCPIAVFTSGIVDSKESLNKESKYISYSAKPVKEEDILRAIDEILLLKEVKDSLILIVDDEPHICEMIAQMLTRWDIKSHSVNSVADALVELKKSSFDVVITDYQMPTKSGVDLIKAAVKFSTASFLLLSGYLTKEIMADESLNIDGFIKKPFSERDLFFKIKNAIRGREIKKTKKRKAKILIVEDCLDNRIITTNFLKNEYVTLVECENGREAIDLFEKEVFDLILMDIQMPVLDGYKATEIIRQKEKEKGVKYPVPIVALSANAFDRDRQRSLEAGCNDHLTKPLRKQYLIDYINDILSVEVVNQKKSA
ncbi:hypothetical protein A9Q84_11345 [Halobacteriovorax marinus]|uniref:Sensory/regulatory protein RpfC n=1 Tax=Halobacteriovorax marinus TaxID=97084 RepID=A0A1Y5F7R1_9BACT|nr:hypothetical protein A9Q84_11345 [Halobacteriovorax marinus]